MNWAQAFYQTKEQLSALYDASEAAAMTHLLLEHISGLSKMERLVQKEEMLNIDQASQLQEAVAQLLQAAPLQYVIGEAWFLERRFMVNPSVLIPRPETEELVLWMARDYAGCNPEILDIGTGSGCIPISLKKELPEAKITAYDISEDALRTATANAVLLDVTISFEQTDILDPAAMTLPGMYDAIVSNPPYIPDAEESSMHRNVTEHEPHLALFVPDNDPLLFYRTVARFGLNHLKPGGQLYFEIHKDYMPETKALLESMGYTAVTPRRDMHDNWRMIRATNPQQNG